MTTWHWEWVFQPKVYWTFGILAAWWAVSLFLATRTGSWMQRNNERAAEAERKHRCDAH